MSQGISSPIFSADSVKFDFSILPPDQFYDVSKVPKYLSEIIEARRSKDGHRNRTINLQFMSVLAGLIGARICYTYDTSSKPVYACIYAIDIGASGSGKTRSWGYVDKIFDGYHKKIKDAEESFIHHLFSGVIIATDGKQKGKIEEIPAHLERYLACVGEHKSFSEARREYLDFLHPSARMNLPIDANIPRSFAANFFVNRCGHFRCDEMPTILASMAHRDSYLTMVAHLFGGADKGLYYKTAASYRYRDAAPSFWFNCPVKTLCEAIGERKIASFKGAGMLARMLFVASEERPLSWCISTDEAPPDGRDVDSVHSFESILAGIMRHLYDRYSEIGASEEDFYMHKVEALMPREVRVYMNDTVVRELGEFVCSQPYIEDAVGYANRVCDQFRSCCVLLATLDVGSVLKDFVVQKHHVDIAKAFVLDDLYNSARIANFVFEKAALFAPATSKRVFSSRKLPPTKNVSEDLPENILYHGKRATLLVPATECRPEEIAQLQKRVAAHEVVSWSDIVNSKIFKDLRDKQDKNKLKKGDIFFIHATHHLLIAMQKAGKADKRTICRAKFNKNLFSDTSDGAMPSDVFDSTFESLERAGVVFRETDEAGKTLYAANSMHIEQAVIEVASMKVKTPHV